MRLKSRRKNYLTEQVNSPYVPKEIDHTSESSLTNKSSVIYNIRTPGKFRFDPYNDVIEPFYHLPPKAFKDISIRTTNSGCTTVNHVLRFVPFNPHKDWCHPLECYQLSHCNGVLTLFIGCRTFYSGRIKDLESYLQVYNVVQTISSTEETNIPTYVNRYKCHDCRKWNENLVIIRHDISQMKLHKEKNISVKITPGVDLISDLYDNYKHPELGNSYTYTDWPVL